MSYKNIFIVILITVGLVTPNLLPIQASVTPTKTLTNEERATLISYLLNQVEILQAQLEILLKDESEISAPISAEDYTKGNPAARVKILTYSDLDCPFCKMFHTTLETVIKYNPAISVTYRHFPLEMLHPNAMKLAIAAECAGQIGGDTAFWSVVDSMFNSRLANQPTDMSSVTSFVTKAGISNKAYDTCASGQVARKAVEADLASGLASDVQGTPQSFVYKDGKMIEKINGSQPLSVVQALITNLLK